MNAGEQNERPPMSELEVVARATVAVAGESAAGMILALTRSGNIAHLLSKYRPGVPVMVFTDSSKVARKLSLRRGVFALAIDKEDVAGISDYERPAEALQIAKEMGWLSAGDKVVIVTAGEDIDPALAEGSVSMRVVTMSDFEGPMFI
uniref:Pyruvate kinase C-terminal domain-containing protein n=1 Tax=Lotharella oceanica TaxID=641309 RepID=A0A7S2XBC1_9EUKA|mmetsp:Transcript_23925/g.44725  ORF Transcript_23925/g.44725 Transcript_23925/m.44725 type:complete len:148 (+) Transcript_23925:208-651(+)